MEKLTVKLVGTEIGPVFFRGKKGNEIIFLFGYSWLSRLAIGIVGKKVSRILSFRGKKSIPNIISSSSGHFRENDPFQTVFLFLIKKERDFFHYLNLDFPG